MPSAYLAEVPPALADALIGLIGQAYWDAYSTIAVYQNGPEPTDFEAIRADLERVTGAARERRRFHNGAWPRILGLFGL